MAPNGPVLSYSVPQSVVTDGVSYIELQLRPSDWLVPTADPNADSPQPAQLRQQTTTLGLQPLPALLPSKPPADGGDRDGPPPNTSTHPVILTCSISDPSDKAGIEVPSSGIAPVVSGSAGVTIGRDVVDVVQVSVNGGGPATATQVTAGTWARWTYTLPLITASCVVTVTATAWNKDRTVSAHQVISFNVTVTPAPPVQDTTAPVVSLDDPPTPIIADTKGVATVTLTGTASDPDDPRGRGLTTFTVLLDGNQIAGVTPDAQGSWTAQTTVNGFGSHEIVVLATNASGLTSSVVKTMNVAAAAPTPPVVQRLLIAERLRLSTFLTAYGVGDPVKTITLLPNEQTQLSIQTFESKIATAAQAESILETNSDSASDDFQGQVDTEQTDKTSHEESKKWHVDASASGQWGVAKASIDAGLAGSTNGAREQVSKSLVSAVNKHAAEKSSQRSANVSTSRETTETSTTTTSTDSTIANINQSCTLNVVVSQMIKQFSTVLHLVDVRVAYVRADLPTPLTGADGTPNPLVWTYHEVTLAQLDGFLDSNVTAARVDAVRAALIQVLSAVFDFTGTQRSMVEERQLVDSTGAPIPNGTYLRVPPQTSDLIDPSLPGPVTVEGIILGLTRNTMRTSSLVADVVKGAGMGLDDYNTQLQALALEEKRLNNAQLQAALDKEKVAADLVATSNSTGATIYGEVYPPPTVLPDGWVAVPSANGGGPQ